MMTIKLYFLNEKTNPNLEDCRNVEPVTRTIPKTKAVAHAALEELFKGVTPDEAKSGFVSFYARRNKGNFKKHQDQKQSRVYKFQQSRL